MGTLSRKFSTATPPASALLQEARDRLFSILDACASLSHAKQVHAQILHHSLHSCSYLLTKLLRTLTRLGVPVEPYPRSVFDRVDCPNPFLFNALIRGYLVEAELGPAAEGYGLMRKAGVRPVSFTFGALFKACGEAKDSGLGRQFHAQTVRVGGFGSDLVVENAMVDMYLKCGYLGCARKVFDEMAERDVVSWTALIVAYAKYGNVDVAKELFDGLPVKDTVAWTVMVTGFAHNGKPREAIECFLGMRNAGVEIDEIALLGLISACTQLGASKYAGWIREIAEKFSTRDGFSVFLGSALIDMYSKCGNVDTAYEIFLRMKKKNVYSYSSMILGFAVHGRAHEALRLFDEMLGTETKPSEVTLIGALTACSHTGMLEQGLQIFESMERCYGVAPSADLYTCLVDMLGRAGCLEQALEVAETMPVMPHSGVWGALLGACHIHGNPDIAEIAARHLFELEPDVPGNYLLLRSTYSSAGRCDDVSRVREIMKTKSLKKSPGCSLLETKDGVTHEFFAGQTTQPSSGETRRALEDLVHSLQFNGYTPNVSYLSCDVGD